MVKRMDIVDPLVYRKRPWSNTVFSGNQLDISQLNQIEACINQFVHKSLDECQLSLYFQSKHDIAINYVTKFFQLEISELTNLDDSIPLLHKIESYTKIACYLFWISIAINEDYEVDFYFFLDQLHSYSLEEVECLHSDDFKALKCAYKQLDYLPFILNQNPMLEIPVDHDGNLVIPEKVLDDLSSDTMIREVFDSLEENGKYFHQHSLDSQIAHYEGMVEDSLREISLLQPSSRRPFQGGPRLPGQAVESRDSISSATTDSKFMAETIASLEREVQLVMDQTLDLELDQLLEALADDQVQSCDEITRWSHSMREKVADYFKTMIENGDAVISTHLTSQVTQDIDLSSIEFEAKLQQTMEKVSVSV
jgi:hypothetical protein